jgi:hypothetical protein
MKKCEYCGKVLEKMDDEEVSEDEMEEEEPEEEIEIKVITAGNEKMGKGVKTLGDIAEKFFKKNK